GIVVHAHQSHRQSNDNEANSKQKCAQRRQRQTEPVLDPGKIDRTHGLKILQPVPGRDSASTMAAGAAKVAECRSHHELGAAPPTGVREGRLTSRLGCRRAPKLVLRVMDQVRHGRSLELYLATL